MAHDHVHRHDAGPGRHRHDHTHGAVDPSLFSTQRGIWAVKWSFAGLMATALFQVVVVALSGSVALLADTVHNVGDAATAIPLWIAFRMARLRPSQRFTYGYGRVEDLAGVVIVAVIAASGVVAGYEAVRHFLEPRPIQHLWAVAVASVVGFAGNEAVALFRIRVGRQIGSAALVADGYHARADGLTSLAVLVGVAGVWLGFPLADPLAGLVITAFIARIVWESGRSVFTRLLDGVDPDVIAEVEHAAGETPGVVEVTEARVRWLGHRLHAEVSVAVPSGLSVEAGHEVAKEVRHRLLHHLRYLSNATIHVDPSSASGTAFHDIPEHEHDGLPSHAHDVRDGTA